MAREVFVFNCNNSSAPVHAVERLGDEGIGGVTYVCRSCPGPKKGDVPLARCSVPGWVGRYDCSPDTQCLFSNPYSLQLRRVVNDTT